MPLILLPSTLIDVSRCTSYRAKIGGVLNWCFILLNDDSCISDHVQEFLLLNRSRNGAALSAKFLLNLDICWAIPKNLLNSVGSVGKSVLISFLLLFYIWKLGSLCISMYM